MNQYTLSNQSIAQMCEVLETFLGEVMEERKEVLRIVLSMEEVLLSYQAQFGQERVCTLRCAKEWGRPRITFTLRGESFDPFVKDDQEDTPILRNLIGSFGNAPAWQYSGGRNVVYLVLPRRKRSTMFNLILALVLAVVLGWLSGYLPDTIRTIIASDILTPLFDTFMGVLSAISGPMIFLSVVWGVYSIGDTVTLGRIGKKMITRFLVLTLALTAIVGMLSLTLFPMVSGVSQLSTGGLSGVYQMVLDIIPNNIVQPFLDNNPMQIICVAVAVGVAIIVQGKKTTVAATALEQTNYIVQYIMECIGALVPGFIFVSIFNMIIQDQLSAMQDAYKLGITLVGGCLVVMIIYSIWVVTKLKLPFSVLLKKLAPTMLVAITTASSSACFACNMETCRDKLGVDEKVVNFGVPLGQVVFMPGVSVLFMTVAMYMADGYSVDITLSWMMMAVVITTILAVAAPPIPGGTMACYTILFIQLGIPSEATAIALLFSMVLEFPVTVADLYALQCELVLLGDSLDLLDRETLEKPM